MKDHKYLLIISLLFCSLLLVSCQPAATPTVPPTQPPTATPPPTEVVEKWEVVAESKAPVLTLLVGFSNATHGISVGDDGYLNYTRDGGQTWTGAENRSMGIYGLEVIDDQVAIGCGNGSHVRATADGGQTWQERENFGGGFPVHCRFLSFLDAQTGWAATPTLLSTTADGGMSWNAANLPEGVTSIAAIFLVTAGQGYLLDTSGNLHSTGDNAQTWSQVGTLPLGDITIASKSYPLAAMNFRDARKGIVVVSALVDGTGLVTAFQTADGGKTWTQELLPAPFGAPAFSRDGRFLTLLMPPSKITVLQYNGE